MKKFICITLALIVSNICNSQILLSTQNECILLKKPDYPSDTITKIASNKILVVLDCVKTRLIKYKVSYKDKIFYIFLNPINGYDTIKRMKKNKDYEILNIKSVTFIKVRYEDKIGYILLDENIANNNNKGYAEDVKYGNIEEVYEKEKQLIDLVNMKAIKKQSDYDLYMWAKNGTAKDFDKYLSIKPNGIYSDEIRKLYSVPF